MSNDKVQQLQMIEQQVQTLMKEKQQYQQQLFEVDSALSELEKTKEAYKILSNVMVKSDKDSLVKELNSNKEKINKRLKYIEDNESKLKEKSKKLQEEVMNEVGNGNNQ